MRAAWVCGVALAVSVSGGAAAQSMNGACDPDVEKDIAVEAVKNLDELEKSMNAVEPPQSVKDISCLEQLLEGGASATFSPPSMGDILGKLEQKACDAADRMVDEATSSLTDKLSASGNLNQMFPGTDLVPVDGGFNVDVSRGRNERFSTNAGEALGEARSGGESFADSVKERRKSLEGLFN